MAMRQVRRYECTRVVLKVFATWNHHSIFTHCLTENARQETYASPEQTVAQSLDYVIQTVNCHVAQCTVVRLNIAA